MNHDVSDVGGPHAETWWHARNTRLRELPWTDSSSLLPDHVCGLLDEVEAAFAMTGARTPAWEGRPVDQSPAEEEYSRCLDPGKFRIIQSRIDAWAKVLVDRGWAHLETDPSNERRGSHEHSQTTLVLRPTAEAHTGGAVPLSYLVYYSTDLEATLNVEVCAGEPPYVLAELPGCGCDACDSGSAWLLEELDQWTLSVVDGSLVVDPAATWQVQTSFGGHGSSGGSSGDSKSAAAFTAAPWATGWNPLRIPDRDETAFPPSSRRGLRIAVGDWFRELIRRLRGQPRLEQGWTIYGPVDRG